MGEIDELLAELKAEYTQQEESTPPVKETLPKEKPLTKEKSSSSNLDQLLAQVKSEIGENQSPKTSQVSTSSQEHNSGNFDRKITQDLLDDLDREYQEKAQIEQRLKQKQIFEQQRLEEQRQQRKQQAMRARAKEWLNQLNPKSEEGRWFEEFSYSYESKLQAAVDYLEALRQTGLPH